MSSSKTRYPILLAVLFTMAVLGAGACSEADDTSNEIDSIDQLDGKGDFKITDDVVIKLLCRKLGVPFEKTCDLCAYFGWYGDGVPDYNLIRTGVCKKGWDPDIPGDQVSLGTVQGLNIITEIAIKLGLGPNGDICGYYGWYGEGIDEKTNLAYEKCDQMFMDLGICKKWDLDCGENPYEVEPTTKELVCEAGKASIPTTPKSGKICKKENGDKDCGEDESCWFINYKEDTTGMCAKRCCQAEAGKASGATLEGEKYPSVCILNFGTNKPAGAAFLCFIQGDPEADNEEDKKDTVLPCPDPENQECKLAIKGLDGLAFCGPKVQK